MKKSIVSIFLALALIVPSLALAQGPTPEDTNSTVNDVNCTMQYEPVCGVDGKTYGNACVATQQNGVDIAYEGECTPADDSSEYIEEELDEEAERNVDRKREGSLDLPREAKNVRRIIEDRASNFIFFNKGEERTLENVRAEIQERVRKEVEERKEFGEEIAERARLIRDLPQEERIQAAKELIEDRREEFMKVAEERREGILEKKEEFQKKVREEREDFQTKILEIQDERKRDIAERIVDRMMDLNERLLENFSRTLNNLEIVLTNIATRADKAEARGADVSVVRTAIDEAHDAVAEARTAIETHLEVVYSITFENEANLGEAISAAKNAMREDLSAIRELVKGAHDATRSAAVTLAQIPNNLLEDEEEDVEEDDVEEIEVEVEGEATSTE